MYDIWLGETKFPIAPDKITTRINGNNKTLNLINESEVNQIKGSKLKDIRFDLLLPWNIYPFMLRSEGQVSSAEEYLKPEKYLRVLEELKKRKTPFSFKLIRKDCSGKVMWDTSEQVTLENFEITEDAENLFDILVSVELKQYVTYGAKKVKVTKNKTIRKSNVDTKKKKIVKSYTTKKGDTLRLVGKKVYGKNTLNNASVLYKNNKKKIDKALKSKFQGKFSKKIYTESLPKGIKMKIPAYVEYLIGEMVKR